MFRAILLIAGFAVLIAGCGASEREDYEKAMRSALADLGETHSIGFGFVDVDMDSEAATLATELGDGYRRSAERFRLIDPPGEVSMNHAELIKILESIASDLRTFAKSGGKDTAALSRSGANLEKLDQPLSQIKRKGYDIGM